MALFTLLTSSLFIRASCMVQKDFDPDLNKLKGLVCYQCNVSHTFCHPFKFFTSPRRAKLDMLIQCPEDAKYCLKREVKIDEENYEVDRSCARAVDSLGKTVRAGCMVTDKMEICLCSKNLCNHANSFMTHCITYSLVLVLLPRVFKVFFL